MMTFDEFWSLAPEQYKDGETLLKKKIKALIDLSSDINAVANRLRYWMDISRAEGGFLDIIASFRNLSRKQGESDSDFRNRITTDVGIDNAGTADFVIDRVSEISGDENPEFMDESPATYFIFTHDEDHPSIETLRRISPAGVLGLPGAAIQFADGSFMGDYGKKKVFLAVADE